jgi:regulatory protein
MEGKITALKSQKRNPNRVNVYLDGEFAFGLSRLKAAYLKIGQDISQNEIQKLKVLDEIDMAYQKVLHFLSFRPRSENEIQEYLRKHNFSDKVIPAVLERLRRNHLSDDLAFAQYWIENRSQFRPRGCYALKAELHQKGIAEDIIEEVIKDLDEEELAYQAAKKQTRKYEQLEWSDYRQKMIAFLSRRGFSFRVAAPVVERIWRECNSSSGAENQLWDW